MRHKKHAIEMYTAIQLAINIMKNKFLSAAIAAFFSAQPVHATVIANNGLITIDSTSSYSGTINDPEFQYFGGFRNIPPNNYMIFGNLSYSDANSVSNTNIFNSDIHFNFSGIQNLTEKLLINIQKKGNATFEATITGDDLIQKNVSGDSTSYFLSKNASSGDSTINVTIKSSTNFSNNLNSFVSLSYEFVSAVPEPSTWAMLLAGLGMIIISTKRKFN